MEQEKKCPECGCTKIVQAQLDINTKLYPINIIFKPGRGSEIVAEVCTNCGYILNMRVTKPNKFR